jgi:hypothetical protein
MLQQGPSWVLGPEPGHQHADFLENHSLVFLIRSDVVVEVGSHLDRGDVMHLRFFTPNSAAILALAMSAVPAIAQGYHWLQFGPRDFELRM